MLPLRYSVLILFSRSWPRIPRQICASECRWRPYDAGSSANPRLAGSTGPVRNVSGFLRRLLRNGQVASGPRSGPPAVDGGLGWSGLWARPCPLSYGQGFSATLSPFTKESRKSYPTGQRFATAFVRRTARHNPWLRTPQLEGLGRDDHL